MVKIAAVSETRSLHPTVRLSRLWTGKPSKSGVAEANTAAYMLTGPAMPINQVKHREGQWSFCDSGGLGGVGETSKQWGSMMQFAY